MWPFSTIRRLRATNKALFDAYWHLRTQDAAPGEIIMLPLGVSMPRALPTPPREVIEMPPGLLRSLPAPTRGGIRIECCVIHNSPEVRF